MSYTGRTAPGAPAQTIDLGTVTLTKLAVGPLDNNVYLLRAPDGSQLLVDAADEPDSGIGDQEVAGNVLIMLLADLVLGACGANSTPSAAGGAARPE